MPPDLRHQARELATATRRAREVYGAGRARTVARALALRARGGFTVEESLMLGLLDPSEPASAARRGLVSKRGAIRVQERFNPARHRHLLDDKEAFARVVAAAGLPAPRTIAVIDPRDGGRLPDGTPLGGLAGWEELIAADPAAAIVLKPVASGRGEGVRVLTRDGDRLAEGEDAFSARDLHEAVLRDGRAHVVQERAIDHPAMQAINRTEALQTCRVMVVEDAAGAHIVGVAGVKLAPRDFRIDGRMRHGTVFGIVDPVTGAVTELWTQGAGGLGLARVNRHPVTGAEVVGVRLPMWEEVRALAIRAAAAFPQLDTFGWDIGITPGGPVLVEGNALWDPLPHRSMEALFRWMRGASRSLG